MCIHTMQKMSAWYQLNWYIQSACNTLWQYSVSRKVTTFTLIVCWINGLLMSSHSHQDNVPESTLLYTRPSKLFLPSTSRISVSLQATAEVRQNIYVIHDVKCICTLFYRGTVAILPTRTFTGLLLAIYDTAKWAAKVQTILLQI